MELVSQWLVVGIWNVYVTTGICTIYYGIGNEVVFHKFEHLCIFDSFFLLHEDNLFERLLVVMKIWLSSYFCVSSLYTQSNYHYKCLTKLRMVQVVGYSYMFDVVVYGIHRFDSRI